MNLHYPDSLPISAEKDHIIETIRQHQIVILAGDTGSGKTTQLPKMCLEAFPDNTLTIGCTQPRRIAATAVSARVAEELGVADDTVAYKIRFHNKTGPNTKIKFMTDGVLLAETRTDPLLKKYGVLIVDEAHERNLNIDFILGYLKNLSRRRPDLKIIITSATIDTKAFSKHFNDAPIISVSGRTYPVTVEYLPPDETSASAKENMVEHCVSVVRNLVAKRPEGDILVFLPTERDIRQCCKLLESSIHGVSVLQLFGRLASGDQRKIFQTTGHLKIIVATNVAETSLTVPGIRYVVDTGLARISNYNVRAKTTSLPISRISQASCDQRKGRCGRIGPGLCLRLYSEEDYNSRDEFTIPEIKRSNLAEVILQMISLKLGSPSNFPFLDPPYKNAISEGYRLLTELGAIDQHKQLTANGKIMADLPIDPCIARIILEAKENGCLKEIKIISAAIAIQDPRIRPAEQEKEADLVHAQFNHLHSDFSTLLNIWDTFHSGTDGKKSWSYLKKFCKTHFLSFQRMREWFDLHEQLGRIISKRKQFIDNETAASYEQIHKSLLSGFLRNLAKRKELKQYQGTHNKEFMIFPGSGQFSKKSDWILCGSFIDTNRLYAINVASISPDWIEPTAGNLCKYSWNNPQWRKKTGTVVAEETASLFGLIISGGRLVNFPKRSAKNIKEARDIFIQNALVHGDINKSYSFLVKNSNRINKWKLSEEKLRARNIVADEYTFFSFYNRVLPDYVCDQSSLNSFLNKHPHHTSLLMNDEDVLLRKLDENELVDFPQTIRVGSIDLKLEYNFNPGSTNDGVSFLLPIGIATQSSQEKFEWLVPGLFHEKLTFLLKALPKMLRKRLVPVSDSVNRILDDIDYRNGPLYATLENSILKLFGFQINRAEWSKELPLHLTPHFILIDEKGSPCFNGRNLKELIESSPKPKSNSPQITSNPQHNSILKKWENNDYTTWDFEGLPQEVTLRNSHGDATQILYPALRSQPEKGSVKVVFTPDFREASNQNYTGTLALYRLQFPEPYKALKKLCKTSLSGPSVLQLLTVAQNKKNLTEIFLLFVLKNIFPDQSTGIITKDTFLRNISDVQKIGFFKKSQELVSSTMSALRQRREVTEAIENVFTKSQQKGHKLPPVKELFHQTLDSFFPLSFLTDTIQLGTHDIERQLRGMKIRLERFYVDPRKDQQKELQLTGYLNQLQEIENLKFDISPEANEELIVFKQMINEYRLVLFSPEIRGGRSVSPKKLSNQWKRLQSLC
ncbi:MAG: ATP-dependent helicase HrpA [Desulforhopalus sp.]|jgi:ATP-dependent helicase HrpA